jgi:hypothetical protein
LNYSEKIISLYNRFHHFISKDTNAILFVFFVALIVRFLPELLVPVYPVGFETVAYYAPALIKPDPVTTNPFLNFNNHIQFISSHKPLADAFRSGPLYYLLSWFVSDLTGVDSFLLLKLTGPLLYACLAASFFVFSKRSLNFKSETAFLATFVLVFQIAALRESTDRFRTELALVFFFAALVAFTSKKPKVNWVATPTLAVLTVLSREYVGLVLILTLAGYAIFEKKDRLKSLATIIPAVVALFAMFNSVWLELNYLSPSSPFYVTSYAWAVQDSFAIFIMCYALILPFVLKGFSKIKLLNPMVAFLMIGSFGFILLPWFAIPGYNRWILLLVYPFCIYTALGLEKINFRKHKKKILAVILFIFSIFGIGYATATFSYIGIIPNSYVATNMLQSSIQWDQINDTQNAIIWLKANATFDSALLAEERFYGWSMIDLEPQNDNINIIAYGSNSPPDPALQQAIQVNAKQIYLIWYTNSSIPNFQIVHAEGDIAILRYTT